MRDVMGLIMLDQGSDPADFSAAEFRAALTMLQRSVNAGQIRIVADTYLPFLVKGDVAAGVVWAATSSPAAKNPALGFTWPRAAGCSGPTT